MHLDDIARLSFDLDTQRRSQSDDMQAVVTSLQPISGVALLTLMPVDRSSSTIIPEPWRWSEVKDQSVRQKRQLKNRCAEPSRMICNEASHVSTEALGGSDIGRLSLTLTS